MDEPEIQPLDLVDGRRIRAVVEGQEAILLLLEAKGAVVDRTSIPFPGRGLAFGELLASPRERFLLLSHCSGQGEESYELFQLAGGLRHLRGSGYFLGEAGSLAFSPDERRIVMALPAQCCEWWQPWEEGDMPKDDQGRSFIDFGVLRIDGIEGGGSEHSLIVRPPAGWEPVREDYDPFLRPRFVAPDRLALRMPWGPLELPLPLPEVVELNAPDARRT